MGSVRLFVAMAAAPLFAQVVPPQEAKASPAPFADVARQSTPTFSKTVTPEMRADILVARKMYREAIDSYKQAPESAVVLNKIGIAYHQLLDLEAARKYYERALKLDKQYAEAINNLGTIALNGAGATTELELIQHGITLQGGGQVTLSDSGANVIIGTAPDVTLTNADNTISGAGLIGGSQLTLVNSGTIIATGANGLLIDTGANILVNGGTLEATGSGGLDIAGDVANNGSLWADGGNITIHGAVTGNGNALIDHGATIEFGGASSVNAIFAANETGTLMLDNALGFTGTVAGFAAGSQIDLGDIQASSAVLSFADNGAGTGGTLTVSDGTHTANVALVGSFDAAGFHLDPDHALGVVITYSDHLLP